MKRFFKVLAGAITAILLSLCCFSLVGCKDIKTIDVHISVYDIENGKFADATAEDDVVITVKLYRHLAPKTVDAVLAYIEKGYYNNAAFYKFEDENTMQINVGDYVFRDGGIHQNKADYLAPVVGEFAKNNTTGSNLTNLSGAVGLWRSWGTEGYKISDNARDSGVATWYLPTQPINDYNDYFCVFGTFDLTDDEDKWDNGDTWGLIRGIFSDENYYTSYTVFYTGEYDAKKGAAESTTSRSPSPPLCTRSSTRMQSPR